MANFQRSVNQYLAPGVVGGWASANPHVSLLQPNSGDLSNANATVTINLGSVDSGDRQRDGMMASKSWFDTSGATFSAPQGVPPFGGARASR